MPRPRVLVPFLQFKKSQVNPTKRRLAAALTIEDLWRIAKRRTPKAAFDYTDGAAEDELSLARARQATTPCWSPSTSRRPARLRDTRNGMSIPPRLTLRTVLDALPRPGWWFDLLTTEPLSFA